ncbi:MAG: hypothetical protein ACRD16_17510 [Thermoanaerobaculia bacterium]
MSRKHLWLFPGVLCLVLCLAACAGVSVTRLGSENPYKDGVRFYRPQPYLLVTDAKGAIETSIIYLPKVNEEYILRVRAGVNGVDAKAAFDQGWNLTSLGDSRTNGLAETLTALGSLGRAAAGFKGALAAPEGELSPGLYAIEFDPATGLAKSLRRVNLNVEAAK